MTLAPPRVFFRTGCEEEEITPPCVKTRSFDSLSVAHILQSKLDTTAIPSAVPAAETDDVDASKPASSPSSPPSPAIDAVAAMLAGGLSHSSHGDDKAADCLLSLATMSTARANGFDSCASARTNKRRHASQSSVDGADERGNAARRRLKLQKSVSGGEAVAAERLAAANAKAAAKAAKLAASQQQAAQKQQQQAAAAAARQQAARQRQQLGAGAAGKARAMTRPAVPQPTAFTVTGVSYPIKLLSGASHTQLKLLAAAFQLCPTPTDEQLHAIASRVSLEPAKLETWFQSRRTLQEWVVGSPCTPAQLANMFYSHNDPDRN